MALSLARPSLQYILLWLYFGSTASFLPSRGFGRHYHDVTATTKNQLYHEQSQVKLTIHQLKNDKAFEEELPNHLPSAKGDGNLPFLVLLSVPFAWGTFEPAVRLVYELDPPVPGFLFGLAYYFVAASSLSILSQITFNHDEKEISDADSSFVGGLELGTYLFVGNALQVVGLETVASDRAAFLLQLTTIFVPILDSLWNQTLISPRTWTACWVALAGVGVLSQDGNDDISLGIQISTGDCFIIAAALSYTFHCLRLEGYARQSRPLSLASSKAWTEFGWSLITVAILTVSSANNSNPSLSFLSKEGGKIQDFTRVMSLQITESGGLTDTPLRTALLATLWTGLVTVAYTITAQSYGQKYVRPVTANIIYTLQPVATALVAGVVLHEFLTPVGYAGAALLGLAVLIIVTAENDL